MPTDPEAFFETPQPAAVLKHALLRRYLYVFASKTGKWAAGHRVVYVDGYAGRGVYKDGSPGSPAIAVEVGEKLGSSRDIAGIFVEENRKLFAFLSGYIAGQRPDWVTRQGDVAGYVDEILAFAGESPMLAFLDPFGLAIPFDQVVKFLQRSQPAPNRRRRTTELLLNVSLFGMRRPGGHLDKSAVSSQGNIATMDACLGGDWWHDIWRSGAADREFQVVNEYVHRLQTAGNGQSMYAVPIADQWMASPTYHLCLFTEHPDGVWAFNDIAPAAVEEFRMHCTGGQGLLMDDSERWVNHIEANIAQILESGQAFTVKDRTVEVFGHALGYAREKYVRQAIKSLHIKGGTPSDGKGPHVGDLVVLPPNR